MTARSKQRRRRSRSDRKILAGLFGGADVQIALSIDHPLPRRWLHFSGGLSAACLLLALAVNSPGKVDARLTDDTGPGATFLNPASESSIEVSRTIRSRLDATVSIEKLTSASRLGEEMTRELECLALNIYHEARGEDLRGKLAVGHVTINRMASGMFPGSICEVVKQGVPEERHRCQFSWWCDGESDEPTDARAWADSIKMARDVFWGRSDDPTSGALWYHADYVKPDWRTAFERGPKIGRHIFYRLPPPTRQQLAGDADNIM